MSQLKSSFAVKSKFEAFYTGGKIQVSSDGVYMFCGCGNKINILEIETGKVHTTIGEEEDEEISTFCLTPDDQYVILATQQLLLRQWDWQERKLVRTWKAIHFAPVVSMAFDCTSTLLATGGADSSIKLWDIEKQYCTHNLRGHQGIISVVAFHPDISRLLLYTAGEDYKIRVWNLKNSKCIAEVAAHYSLVTCIGFSADGSDVYTTGRDGVVSILDAESHAVKKTIPVFEVVESLIILPEDTDYPAINVDSESIYFITAGNKGNLRLWNSDSGKCVFTTDAVHSKHQIAGDLSAVKQEADDSQNIVQMIYNKQKNNITVVTYDQNISILSLEKLRLQKQFAGNNDEILDVQYFGEDEKFAVVATNSRHIKVFELSNCDCEILYGHTDLVLSIDVVPKSDMFISGAKDNTVRLWKINPIQKQVWCLAVGQGHTHAVGAVAVSRVKPKFFVSGSEDCTLKLWQIPDDLDFSVTKEIHAMVTEKAHDKTISSVVVAPNDKFIASGSMDKTAKLWKASDLSLIGVMRGHKRGIWCVEFSPIDQILATSSGDGTVKLWSLTDFSCVRTFEGHDCAVLKVAFITRGMQLLSSGTNGLIKLWTIKSNECVKTMDEHEDKVWAMAVGVAGDSFITGGADSNLIIWKDVTETEQNEVRQKQEEFILQEQELSNLIQQKKYLKAIGLAINLEQPYRLLNILKEILSEEAGEDNLYKTLEKLRMDQIDALLRFAVQWNTNSRHCHEAQVVISTVLKMYPPNQLKELGNLKSSVEGLLPYTERHFRRMSRLVQQSVFLEYTWQCMKGLSSEQPADEPIAGIMGENSRAASENVDQTGSESDDESSSSESELEPDSETHDMDKQSKNMETRKEKDSSEDVMKDRESSGSSSTESEEDFEGTTTTTSGHNNKVSKIGTNRDINEGSKGVPEKDAEAKTRKLQRTYEKNNLGPRRGQTKYMAVKSGKVSESGEDSDESESGKENNLEDKKQRDKVNLIPKSKANEDIDSLSSESESESADSDSFSSAYDTKEEFRTVKSSASTGKRPEKGSSIAESSESDDDVETEDVGLKSAESVRNGAGAMEEEEEDMSESEAEEEELTGGNIKKNLFKPFMSRKKTRQSSMQKANEDKRSNKTNAVESGQKRKMTDTYTVVKRKTPKVVDIQYFIDRKAEPQERTENDREEDQTTKTLSEKKPTAVQKSRKTTKRDRLKKLKKPGRR